MISVLLKVLFSAIKEVPGVHGWDLSCQVWCLGRTRNRGSPEQRANEVSYGVRRGKGRGGKQNHRRKCCMARGIPHHRSPVPRTSSSDVPHWYSCRKDTSLWLALTQSCLLSLSFHSEIFPTPNKCFTRGEYHNRTLLAML